MIKFQEVSIQKGEREVLEDIFWEAKKGENWAIMGSTGAGKSTFLEAIAGKIFPIRGYIQKPPSNQIVFVAKDYSFNRIVESAVQYYQQRFNANDTEITPTVREILQNQLKPIGTIDEKSIDLPPQPFAEETIQETSNLLKINHLLDKKIVSLSNGETRRVLLTLSLLQKPSFLLLDNPFVGLDIESRAILHQILNQIAELGVQLILVTSPKEIPSCITHFLKLKNGKIQSISTNKPDFQQVIHNEKINVDIDAVSMEAFKNNFIDFKYAVHLKNIKVSYKGINVVDDVSWKVKKGEKWALMGPNGSGKSTILSLITGDNPQGYQNDYVLFDRKRGSGESIWEIKQRIGYVSPELHLYFNRNTEVWKAVASGLFDSAGLFQKLKPEEKNLVEGYLRLLNINHLQNRKLYQLSTGEQRQVFLARALVKNPPLLLLDEPCQGLDYDHMIYFRTLVNELVLKLEKTLIYVTHYEEELPACINKILRLSNGKVMDK